MDRECDVCMEPVLESERMFRIVITDEEGIVIDSSNVCEECKCMVEKVIE